MNTIERVARGIENARNVPHDQTYGSYDYSNYPGDAPPYVIRSPGQKDVVLRTNNQSEANALWSKLEGERIAKAALDALCEGLEWRSGPDYSEGFSDLWFNGFCIAYVELEEGEYLAHFRLIPEALYKTEKEAQDALIQAARNWIMGVETVTEKG